MQNFLGDLRQALRALRASPGFVAACLTALVLGIGANTAIFAILDAVLLRPLPFPDADRLVVLWETSEAKGARSRPSPGDFLDWRRRSHSFDGIAAWYPGSVILRDSGTGGEPETVRSCKVSPNFFDVLRVPPSLGRTFDKEGDRGVVVNVADMVRSGQMEVVLSHAFWQRRFGGDRSVLGRTIALDGVSYQVLGVMPPRFALPDERTELWIAWDIPGSYASFSKGPPRDFRFLQTVGRLKAGVSEDAAQSEMDSLMATIAREFPDTNRGWGVRLVPLQKELSGRAAPSLYVLFLATFFALLIACVNIATLQLSRAAAKSRDVAIRVALGISRSRLAGRFLLESLLIALAGAALGLLLARLLKTAILKLQPWNLPRAGDIVVDGRVIGFALATAVLATLMSGLAPAVAAFRLNVSESLRDGGTKGASGTASSGARLRRAFVVIEIAAALTLVAGAGLFMTSFRNLASLNPGFDPDRLLVMRLSLDKSSYKSAAKSNAFYQDLMSRLSSLPGVEAAGGVTALPLSDVNIDFSRPYWREGDEAPGGSAPNADIRMATRRYFETMRMSLRRGRSFADTDRLETPRVVIVNETMARASWPGEDPIGKRLLIDYKGGAYPYEIVGVVSDTRFHGPRSTPRSEIFIPHSQNPYLDLNVVLRTSREPQSVAAAARREVLAVDPAQPVHSVVTMERLMARSVAADRFSVWLVSALSAVALLLAGTGIFGVLAHHVGARTHEIGVRMALGASRRDVLLLVLWESGRLAAQGAGLGLVLSVLLARSLDHAGVLFGVDVTRVATLATVLVPLLVALATTAALASWIPARRALRIAPQQALQAQ